MQYLSYRPRPPLNEFVERFWLCTDGQSHRRERILPSGTIELVVNLFADEVRIHDGDDPKHPKRFSGIVASGTYPGVFDIDAMQLAAIFGVHFRPGGACAILGVPASELTSAHVDLGALWGERRARHLRQRLCEASTSRERFRLMEDALLARVPSSASRHPLVRTALQLFGQSGGESSVRAVAQRVGLSQRRFISVFAAQVGLTPKLFCRVVRFHHVRALALRNSKIAWAQLALDAGYFDQSHLSNEFRTLSGLSPTEYLQQLQDSTDLLPSHVALV